MIYTSSEVVLKSEVRAVDSTKIELVVVVVFYFNNTTSNSQYVHLLRYYTAINVYNTNIMESYIRSLNI